MDVCDVEGGNGQGRDVIFPHFIRESILLPMRESLSYE